MDGIQFCVLSACVGVGMREQDNVVIRIRYKDFSAGTHNFTGLNGVARRGARGVTVYLIPGLTVRERKAVLRRLRQEASRGFGPPLPLLALAFALCADRVRTTAGTGAAVIRLHPAVTLLPGAFVAALMTLFVCASASRAVDFTPENGLLPQVGGLALSQADTVGQRGRPQESPVWDRQMFTAGDSSGQAQGDEGGQPLSPAKPAHGRCAHSGCAKGKAKGDTRAKGGYASSGYASSGYASSGYASSGHGKVSTGNGGPVSGPRLMTLPPLKCAVASPGGCSAGVRPAGLPRCPRDHPMAGPAGLGTVKRGVGIGQHRR